MKILPEEWDSLHDGWREDDKQKTDLLFAYLYDAIPLLLLRIDPHLKPQEVEELAAALIARLFTNRQLEQYQPNRKFFGWLYRIVVNARADYLRRLKKIREVFGPSMDDDDWIEKPSDRTGPGSFNPAQEVIHAETMDILLDCLKELSPSDHDLLLRRLVHGEEYEDIAASLGITAGRVHTRVCRARTRWAQKVLARGLVMTGDAPENKKRKESRGKGVLA
ncbi:MAG TPA: sigma-70 family RNA polymerase sigma factor [Kiritimatiellia bacterium]|nr:sigma-70 family RNA polymerase sigma factor [Kiritimatiellia bacterium]HMO99919.1 sigma-70 family RNA polymerase sigma factor [Kiritimatiellia bacterium]HMP96060.1 sigma-70 family RNA polymerase sigma factor [Kiritimatiellia bacterium]